MLIKYIVLCFSFTFAQGVIYKYVTEDSILQLTCTYENECAEDDIIIQADDGYKVLVTVKSVDIDGESGDFLLVKSGTAIDDEFNGRMFTYKINEEKECLSINENVYIHFGIQGSNENNHTGFILTAELFGEQVTTPRPTTTDVPWPTISDDETPYITANMTITEFNDDIVNDFRSIVAKMAIEYVASQTDFELDEEISTDNVHINRVIQCPIYWLNMENCFQFTFAVPLLLVEDSEHYGSYQLNETHLKAMWQNGSHYFGDSTDSSLYPYELPDNTRIIAIWLSIICSVTLAFGVIYLVSGYQCTGYVIKKKKHALLEQQNESNLDDKRNSASSLTPHPLQTMPPLFDSSMPYFEPDSPPFRRSTSPENPRERERQFAFDGVTLREASDI